MEKYKCLGCDYVYDPAVGDPANGIPAGTSFEDIPESWTCPECGLPKDSFEVAQ
ncbi:MAG: rubredoxin [Erysipelotrichaceae bacterium]